MALVVDYEDLLECSLEHLRPGEVFDILDSRHASCLSWDLSLGFIGLPQPMLFFLSYKNSPVSPMNSKSEQTFMKTYRGWGNPRVVGRFVFNLFSVVYDLIFIGVWCILTSSKPVEITARQISCVVDTEPPRGEELVRQLAPLALSISEIC